MVQRVKELFTKPDDLHLILRIAGGRKITLPFTQTGGQS